MGLFSKTKNDVPAAGAAAPDPAGELRAVSAATRAAGLAARETELARTLEADLEALERQRQNRRDAHARAVEEARATVEARRAELDAEMAAEIRARLYPALVDFGSDPRKATLAAVEVLRDLCARTRDAVGDGPWPGHVCLGLAAGFGPDVLARVAYALVESDGPMLEAGTRVLEAVGHAVPAPIVEDFLRSAERSVAARAANTAPASGERLEAIQGHASRVGVLGALTAVREREHAEEQARHARDYRPPPDIKALRNGAHYFG